MSAQDSDHNDALDLTDHSDHLLTGPIPPDHRIEPDHHGVDTAPPPVTPVTSSPVAVPVSPSLAANNGRMVAAGLSALTFAAIVLLGWMILRNPLWETRSTSTATSPSASTDKAPFLIGAIMPLTGDAASYGIPNQKVAQMIQKEINTAGGVGGRPLVIEWEDGRCEGPTAKAAAEKLINEKKVQYLIGGICSSEFLAAAPIAQDKKVLTFSPSATSPKISALGKYIFRTIPSDAVAGQVAAQYAAKTWEAQTAAIISEQSDYPQGLRGVFTQEFTKAGGVVVTDEVYETGTTNFTALANKVKASRADVVYLAPQTATPGVLLITALKKAGVTARILTAEVLIMPDAVSKQGNLLQGITGVNVLFDDQRPKTKDFFMRYKAAYGLDITDPTYMSGTYDILTLIKEAHERVGDDPDRVADYLYSLDGWEGAVGDIKFDKNGDPSLSFAIRTVTNGEAILVDTYIPQSNE